jgi:hypothetical protein
MIYYAILGLCTVSPPCSQVHGLSFLDIIFTLGSSLIGNVSAFLLLVLGWFRYIDTFYVSDDLERDISGENAFK